ncbi:MAG: hypothetical protein GIX01_09605 [Candidatus Eremiobacteraeota bacterium]|nr:hypothetical protein [Candidatus Eremiobacteraeota bacterium]
MSAESGPAAPGPSSGALTPMDAGRSMGATLGFSDGYARERPFSHIHADLRFLDNGTTLQVMGYATGMTPNLSYVSFVYGNGSVARGSTACLPPSPNNFTFNQMVLGYWLPLGSSERTLVVTKTGSNGMPTDYASLAQFATASIRWDTTPAQSLAVNQSPARYYLQTCTGVHESQFADDGNYDAAIAGILDRDSQVPAADTALSSGAGYGHERPFSPIRARIHFKDDGTTLTVRGEARGMNPSLSYISFIYGTGSVGRGSTACLPPTPNNLTFNQMVLGYWLPDRQIPPNVVRGENRKQQRADGLRFPHAVRHLVNPLGYDADAVARGESESRTLLPANVQHGQGHRRRHGWRRRQRRLI